MPRTPVAVDICNTLADINGEIEKVFGANPNPSRYYYPGVTSEFFRNNLWVFEKAAAYKGAAKALTKISLYYEIVYITARPVEAQSVTIEWLKRNGFPRGRIIFTTTKPVIAKALGVKAAFDDAPHEIDGYLAAGIPVFVKKQPYNMAYPNIFDWAGAEIMSFSH